MAESRWSGEQAWVTRLNEDRETLQARLTPDQMRELGRLVAMIDDPVQADFLVVYGSVARGTHGDASDIDIYFEASYLPRRINIREQSPGRLFHGYGMPRGVLLDNLRSGKDFAFSLIDEALVFVDRGAFRELLIVRDEEELTET
jgi:hypothetical protein